MAPASATGWRWLRPSLILVACVAATLARSMIADSTDASKSLTRIAFGSCNHQNRPQPLWPAIAEYNPELFIWLGDVVYNDIHLIAFFFRENALDLMEANYRKQKHHEGYQQLLNTNATIIGTWVRVVSQNLTIHNHIFSSLKF